jgi:hypothetical protein
MKIPVFMMLTTCVATGCLERGYNNAESANSASPRGERSDACKAINRVSLQNDVDRFSGLRKNYTNKWFVRNISKYQGACVVLLSELNGDVGSSAAIDVVVFDPRVKKLITVGDFLGDKIPKTLRAKIGEAHDGENSPSYFAEFTGDSVVDIYKVILSQFPKTEAFSACVANEKKQINGVQTHIPTGKLDWDPTPNRSWRVSNAEFDILVASRNEVDAVYAKQLDSDFNGHINGTLPCEKPYSERGHVGPWGGFVDEIFLEGKWTPVKYSPAYPDVRAPIPQNGPKYNYEVQITPGANFAACYARFEKISQIKKISIVKTGVPGMEEPFAANLLIAEPVEGVLAKIKAQPDCFSNIVKL